MNQRRVKDLFDIDPFDDAFRGFLRPWKFNGVLELLLPKKAAASTKRLAVG